MDDLRAALLELSADKQRVVQAFSSAFVFPVQPSPSQVYRGTLGNFAQLPAGPGLGLQQALTDEAGNTMKAETGGTFVLASSSGALSRRLGTLHDETGDDICQQWAQ